MDDLAQGTHMRGKAGRRKAHHPYARKEAMLARLRKIEGQIRGISKMIEDDLYCDDILHQFMSVESALAGVKTNLLDAHVRSCVVEQLREGDDAVVDELMATVLKMVR